MISTNEEFCNESKKFLNKEWIYFNINSPFDIETLAIEYVKNNPNFKHVVRVEIIEIKDKSYIIRTTIPAIKDFSQDTEVFLVE